MTTPAQYDRARAALAEATRIDEVLPLRAQMEHIKLHAKHVQDRELMADATEIQIRAEQKLGFLLGEAKKAGLLKASRPKKPDPKKPADVEGFTLKEIGVTEKLSSASQKKASLSEQALEAMIAGIRGRIISGKAKIIGEETVNGARSIMGSRQEPDDSLDYFPTPPWATRALFECVLTHLKVPHVRSAWDPACGEGHMAEAMRSYVTGPVHATDIYDYGYGDVLDYLADQKIHPPETNGVKWIISNPPFGDKTEAFVHRALIEASTGVAMFVRLQWLETVGRYERIFKDHPPTLIAFFAERVPLCKGEWKPDGDTATAYIWLIWIKGRKPQAPFWIPPGQREALTHPSDVEKYTTHPVTKTVLCDESFDADTGEILPPPITSGEHQKPKAEMVRP